MNHQIFGVRQGLMPVALRAAVGVLLLVLVGCAPQTAPRSAPLPTLVPTGAPAEFGLDHANRVALEFLDAWTRSNFDEMHGLLSFASREATPPDNFRTLYETAHNVMTLNRLAYTAVASGRDVTTPRVVVFNYDVTFQTRLLGSFTDSGRELRLVFDEAVNGWRVAWSPGDIFRELGSGGQLRLETTPVRRGSIYDNAGGVLADMDNTVIMVSVVRRNLTDEALCLAALTEALAPLAPEIVRARLEAAAPDWRAEIGTLEPDAYTIWKDRLDSDCQAGYDTRKTRRYHQGTLLPHILGAVGYLTEADLAAAEAVGFNQDSILGRSGIEQSQDVKLRGTPGARLLIVAPDGTTLREVVSKPVQTAESVWLTLDTDLQRAVLDTITRTYAGNEALNRVSKGGAVIVMEVNTGKILAMVSYPTYNANALTPFPSIGRENADKVLAELQASERNPLLNRATQGRYPSGSVMKIGTAMAVVDSGVFTADQRYICGGSWTHDGVTLYDWLPGGHGLVTPISAVTQSCNPFFYEVGYQMNLRDPYLLPNYLRQLGLGEPTGLVDIPEDSGYIGDVDTLRVKYGVQWSFSDASRMAIGQGEVEITPLQIARLTAAIANGGSLYQPQLVWRTGILADFTYIAEPQVNGNINIKPEVIDLVREGMCAVTVAASGTAEFVFRDSPLLEIGVCGKTGTAQDLPRPTTHAWFTAYAPKDDPEIVVVAIVENAGEGSAVAAPIVRDVMEYYFFGADGSPAPTS